MTQSFEGPPRHDRRPELHTTNGNLCLEYVLEDGTVTSDAFDMVVLSVGLQVPESASAVAERLGIELNEYKFTDSDPFAPVETSRDAVLRYQGVDVDPVNWGWLCDRGRFNFEAVNSDQRLENPHVRTDGGLTKTTWNAALAGAAFLIYGQGAASERSTLDWLLIAGFAVVGIAEAADAARSGDAEAEPRSGDAEPADPRSDDDAVPVRIALREVDTAVTRRLDRRRRGPRSLCRAQCLAHRRQCVLAAHVEAKRAD